MSKVKRMRPTKIYASVGVYSGRVYRVSLRRSDFYRIGGERVVVFTLRPPAPRRKAKRKVTR